MPAVAEGKGTVERRDRHVGILAALGAAIPGFAFGEALAAARTSDAFLVAPSLARMGGYALSFLLLVGLALALEIGGPPLATHGGRAARQIRAAIRRRFRHGRSRAEIARVESGLTVSACLVLGALGLVFATPKAILAVAVAAALILTVRALFALCRLVDFAPRWCGALGLLYGLGAGYLFA